MRTAQLLTLAALCSVAGAACAPDARAAESFAVNLAAGLSTFSLAAGSSYEREGGMGLEMRLQIGYEMSSINTAIGAFYQGHLGSTLGAFPLSRFGVAGYYYFFGLPMASDERDNGVSMSQSRIAPFVTGQAAYLVAAITDATDPASPVPFNAQAFNYLVGAGIEIPLGQSTSIQLMGLYEGTLAGGRFDKTGTITTSGISVNVLAGMLGVTVRP